MSTSRNKLKFDRSIAEAASKSPFVWAVSYVALPKGVEWSFDDMKWQVAILDDLHPSIVSMKPTQIGHTTIATLKALWFISYNQSRAMYTLPRRDDVTDYTVSTVDPIIEHSEFLSVRTTSSSTRLKRVGDSFFHIMEASVTPRMLPVDILVNDEVDLSDQDNLEQFVARLDRSKYQYHYRFSTPTVSGFGIDAEYARSDRREWVITCSRCNNELVLDWNIHLVREKVPYYECDKCHQVLRIEDIVNGEWIAQSPSSNIHGYHISHMMMPISRPPAKLIEEEIVMDTRTFYNLRLGAPWRPVGGSMPLVLFMEHAFRSGHVMQAHKEKGYTYYLGADQANDIHVIVGRVANNSEHIEIIYVEHIKHSVDSDQFDRLGAIIRMFDIDFGVCDANPNRASIYSIAREFNGKIGAADIGAYNYPFKWHGFEGDSAYKIVCNRADALDGLRDDIGNERMSFWGTWEGRDKIVSDVIDQCGNLKRDTAKRKLQSGGEKVVSVWRKTGPDHFAFALAMLRLAVMISPNKSSFDFAVIGDDGARSRSVKESKVWKGLVYEVEEHDHEMAYIG